MRTCFRCHSNSDHDVDVFFFIAYPAAESLTKIASARDRDRVTCYNVNVNCSVKANIIKFNF